MLTIKQVLQEAAGKRVLLVEEPDGKQSVLKRPCARLEREFLRAVAGRAFRSLDFPRLLDEGDDFVRVAFLDREHHTRDSILERRWTPEDVRLWVDGLLEFQRIRLPARPFGAKRRVLGWMYPVFRALQMRAPLGPTLSYALARPFFRNRTCHYDLQTYNYAFRVGARKMSLLDFEFSYYSGDPLFDLLYFCSIPTVRLEDWTFQKELVREFLRRSPQRCAAARTRLILLVCQAARARFLPGKRAAYTPNLALLRDRARFRAWFDALRA